MYMIFTRKKNLYKSEKILDEEAKLIQLAKEDISQFELLYDKYYEDVVRFVYQRVDTKASAFDVAQQTFIKAMNNIHKYEHRGVPFSAWLFRIAINEVNQLYRKNKREQAINISSENIVDIMDEVDDYQEKEDQLNRLGKALQQLKKEQVELINLRYFEQRSFKEIADILSITEGNAKMKVHRIIKKLKELI